MTAVDVERAPRTNPNWAPGMKPEGTLDTQADPDTGTFTTYNFEVADWHTYFAAPAVTSTNSLAVLVSQPECQDLPQGTPGRT